MNVYACMCCWSDHDIRSLPNSPIAVNGWPTCICRKCYGTDPQEPDFETLPQLSGLPVAQPRRGGETSPEA